MARDPLDADCNLCDAHRVPMLNTGFVVAQNLPFTREILDVWMACTGGGTRYGEECAKWKGKWAHEQAVFSDYLRYDYNPEGDNIRVSVSMLFPWFCSTGCWALGWVQTEKAYMNKRSDKPFVIRC